MNDILRYAAFPQKFRRFQTVLGRIQVKINIMQQADTNTVPLFRSIAEFSRIPFHHSLYGKRMLNMEGIFVVFF